MAPTAHLAPVIPGTAGPGDPGQQIAGLPSQQQPQLLTNISQLHRTVSEGVVSHYNVQPVFEVYADVQGNIGYIMAARVPLRKKGHGEVPEPGDTDDYTWTGYLPFDQLPQALDPESGLIVTANARAVGKRCAGDLRKAETTEGMTARRGTRVVPEPLSSPA